MSAISENEAAPPFEHESVRDAFLAMPPAARQQLLAVRSLIFRTAAETPGVGALEETVKWGQPSYSTVQSGSGTPIRLGVPKNGGAGIFTHCQTSVIPDFRAQFPDSQTYDGNRGIILPPDTSPDLDQLRLFVVSALTYHQRRA